MKNATCEYIRKMSADLTKAAEMEESERKHEIIMDIARELNETIPKIAGAA